MSTCENIAQFSCFVYTSEENDRGGRLRTTRATDSGNVTVFAVVVVVVVTCNVKTFDTYV